MYFVLSTNFNNEIYKVSQKIEIKVNEVQKAFEVCRAFVIGSKSCKISIFYDKNRTKMPDIYAVLNIRDAAYVGGILTNEKIFTDWVLKF